MGSNVFFATMAKAVLPRWQISGHVLGLVRPRTGPRGGKSNEISTSPQRDSRTGRGNVSGYCPRDFVESRCLKKLSIYQSTFLTTLKHQSHILVKFFTPFLLAPPRRVCSKRERESCTWRRIPLGRWYPRPVSAPHAPRHRPLRWTARVLRCEVLARGGRASGILGWRCGVQAVFRG